MTEEKQDRYYMWLDDWASCTPGEYRIGDSFVHCGDDCEGRCWDSDHEVETFYIPSRRGNPDAEPEESVKDRAVARLDELNEWWDAQTMQSVALALQESEDNLRGSRTWVKTLESYLNDAVSLVVRLNHEHVEGQADLALDADIEKFFQSYFTKQAIPDELVNVAYGDGLPVDYRRKRELLKTTLIGGSDV